MAIIYSYPINTNILATDIIVGSSTVIVNGRPKNQTKSFEIQDLAAYFASVIVPPGSYVPYIGAVSSVNLGVYNLTATSIIKAGGTNAQYLMADGSISTGANVPAAALTKTDDTNVTLTLGGSPATALLAATSLTLGWNGTLADSRITSAAIWNAKQDAITLTTTGTGAATFVANVLNIPNYSSSLSGTINRVSKFNTTTSISDSTIEDNGSSVIINRPNGSTSGYKLDVNGPVFCDYGTSNVINVPSAININMPYYNLAGGTPDASIVNINGKGPLANGHMTGYNVQVSGPDNFGFFGDFSDTAAASIGINLYSRTLHTGDFVNYNKYSGLTSTIVHKIDNAGNVTSASYIKTGGTNLQFLMADGSVSTAPSLTGFVPYTGATQAVNLGAYDLTVNSISVGRGSGSGADNTVVGNLALSSATTGFNNTAFGSGALKSTTTGHQNVAIGYNSLTNGTSLARITAIGWSAGENHTSTIGSGSVYIGFSAGKSTTSAYNCTFIGANAAVNHTTGNWNTGIGESCMQFGTTGNQNTALGVRALLNNTVGSFNIAIGGFAANLIGSGTNNTVSNNSIFIGANTRALNDNETNQIVIGDSAIGAGSNTVTLGNVNVITTRLRGAVRGGSFVKDSGTATQFLMADGSVSTAPSLTGFVPYAGATQNVNLGSFALTATSIVKAGGTNLQFLMADGSVTTSVPSGYKYNFSGSLTLTGTLTTTNLLTITIPANSLTDGYLDLRSLMIQQSGAALAGMQVRVWHNSVNDFNTATRIANYAFGGGGADLFAQITRKFSIQSGTLFGFSATPSNATGDGSNANTPLSIAFNTAITNYLFVSVQLNNVTDTATLRNVNIID